MSKRSNDTRAVMRSVESGTARVVVVGSSPTWGATKKEHRMMFFFCAFKGAFEFVTTKVNSREAVQLHHIRACPVM